MSPTTPRCWALLLSGFATTRFRRGSSADSCRLWWGVGNLVGRGAVELRQRTSRREILIPCSKGLISKARYRRGMLTLFVYHADGESPVCLA